MLKQSSAFALAAGLCACASTPDVTYNYYQPKSATTISVTQNLQCIKDPNAKDPKTHKPITKYTDLDVTTSIATPTTNYSTDFSQSAQQVRLRDLDGTFSDTDASFTVTEDDRLVSMNATSTGQAQAILTSVISLASAAAKFGAVLGAASDGTHGPKPLSPDEVCQKLMSWPNSDKQLSLTFTSVTDFGAAALEWQKTKIGFPAVLNDGSPGTIISDRGLYAYLVGAGVKLPQVTVRVGFASTNVRAVTYNASTSGDVVTLQLQDTASVELDYKVADPKTGNDVPAAYSNTIVVPLKGSTYPVALPKGAAFGASKVVLSLAPSGAITTLEYSKTNGAAGAAAVATAAFTAATPASTTPPASPGNTTQPPPNTNPNPQGGPNTNPHP